MEKLGVSSNALPGVHRVGIVDKRDPGELSAATTVGYGMTEAQSPTDGTHHRLLSRLAGAAALWDWLSVGLSVDGRYDRHPSDERGSDDGGVFNPMLQARAGSHSGAGRFGGELRLWTPGSEQASTSLSGTSVDGLFLAATDLGPLILAGQIGYRLDQSNAAGQDAARLREGDRVGLGLSDFDAVLMGVGVSWRLSNTELLAELSGDLLVGQQAPPLLQSPLRVSGGARHALSKSLALEVMADVSMSSRPDVSPEAPLVPIEPRLLGFLGLRYQSYEEPRTAPAPRRLTRSSPPPRASEPPAPKGASVVLDLKDDSGEANANAQVTLRQDDESTAFEQPVPGRYELSDIPPGRAQLEVSVDGFEPIRRPLKLNPNERVTLELSLKPALPPGQVRGVVRSFSGKPVLAEIQVIRIDTAATATGNDAQPAIDLVKTGTDGAFQVDVAPGQYEVVIEAPGYKQQRRQVTVEQEGVVILNADLRKQR